MLVGANVQGRYNPKEKRQPALRRERPTAADFDNREDQTDIRDGTDYSLNATWGIDGETADFELSRTTTSAPTAPRPSARSSTTTRTSTGTRPPAARSTTRSQEIDQDNYALSRRTPPGMGGGRTDLDCRLSRASIRHHQRRGGSRLRRRGLAAVLGRLRGRRWLPPTSRDTRVRGSSSRTSAPLGGAKMEFGVDYARQAARHRAVHQRGRSRRTRATPLPPYVDFDLRATAASRRTALDPYLMFSRQGTARSTGRPACATRPPTYRHRGRRRRRRVDNDYDDLLPSVHLRWNSSATDRITLSLARTVRRPNFNQHLAAARSRTSSATTTSSAIRCCKPEKAWGVDLGYRAPPRPRAAWSASTSSTATSRT